MSKTSLVKASMALLRRDVPSDRVRELLEMLTYRRPAGSAGELAFIARYLVPLGCHADEFGNYWLRVDDTPILWCSHTDTVHDTDGRQKVLWGDAIASAEGSNCLGADCTTGVWLMRNMIKHAVGGTYLFHRGEECGGKGSAWIAEHRVRDLLRFQFAIAFDRKGVGEVITHQFGRRTCSGEFAASMCEALFPMRYEASDGGTFTDTENYAAIIPECSNIGVGYAGQHTAAEIQLTDHAEALLERLILADWSRLVCSRDPGSEEYADDFAGWYREDTGDLASFVYEKHVIVAEYLAEMGVTVGDLREFEEENYMPHGWDRLR